MMDKPILLLINDMFFAVKISNDLRQLGYQPVAVRSAADLSLKLDASPRPPLVLLDLMIRGLDWEAALRQVAAEGKLAGVTVIGFGPHTDRELRRRALDAGVSRVLANSKVMSDVGKLVGKYES